MNILIFDDTYVSQEHEDGTVIKFRKDDITTVSKDFNSSHVILHAEDGQVLKASLKSESEDCVSALKNRILKNL